MRNFTIPHDRLAEIERAVWVIAGMVGDAIPEEELTGIDADYAGFRTLHQLMLSMAENRVAAITREDMS